MRGALTLYDFDSDDMLRLAFAKCGRAGQLRVAPLRVKFGRDISLPELMRQLAHCPRAGNMNDPCGAIYPDLLARYRGEQQ